MRMSAGDQAMARASETKRRQGGRRARKAMRAAGVSADLAPVTPGFESGRYKPLSGPDVEAIHRAALTVLAEIGMGEVPAIVMERALSRGCSATDTGRLLFPRSFVEDTIAGAARQFVLHGRRPEHDIEVGGKRVYYGTGGAAVQVLDMATRGLPRGDTRRPLRFRPPRRPPRQCLLVHALRRRDRCRRPI